MGSDATFEVWCRSVPGVTGVSRVDSSYCICVQAPDYYPVRRAVHRWMKEHNRSFKLAWDVQKSTTPSSYDAMDRAISSLTYIHRPD